MLKILSIIMLLFSLLTTNVTPVFASEDQVIDQTYIEWDSKKDVPVNKVWSIKFSHPVLESTINDQNIYVLNKNNEKYTIKLSLSDDKTIQITPLEDYKQGEVYTLYIIKDVSNSEKQTYLKNSVKMGFTIINEDVNIPDNPDDPITIKLINPNSITTPIGIYPVLPKTVVAYMSNKKVESFNVTWDIIESSKYQTAGKFTISGTIAESNTLKAVANISVIDLESIIIAIPDIVQTVNHGGKYSFPRSIRVNTNDIYRSRRVEVTWNPSNIIATELGIWTYYGTINETTLKVPAIITVIPVISYVPEITQTINQGDSFEPPSTIEVTMSDDSKENLKINWYYSNVDTSKIGSYICQGSVGGWDKPIVIKVEVK